MPCYVQVRIFEEEFEDLPAMKAAVKAMKLTMETRGGEIWIGGTIKVKQQGKKYLMSTQNRSTLQSLMDEYAAAKLEREAQRRNMNVTREKVNGKITIKISER